MFVSLASFVHTHYFIFTESIGLCSCKKTLNKHCLLQLSHNKIFQETGPHLFDAPETTFYEFAGGLWLVRSYLPTESV